MTAVPKMVFAPPTYKSSTTRLREPFVREMYEVFRQLEMLAPKGNKPPADGGPPSETVEWAKRVLLRVLPRRLLIGAEIDAFQREIHATWDNDEKGKRVVIFFPAPQQLKIYYELVSNDIVVDHKLVNTTSVADVCERLLWFFQ